MRRRLKPEAEALSKGRSQEAERTQTEPEAGSCDILPHDQFVEPSPHSVDIMTTAKPVFAPFYTSTESNGESRIGTRKTLDKYTLQRLHQTCHKPFSRSPRAIAFLVGDRSSRALTSPKSFSSFSITNAAAAAAAAALLDTRLPLLWATGEARPPGLQPFFHFLGLTVGESRRGSSMQSLDGRGRRDVEEEEESLSALCLCLASPLLLLLVEEEGERTACGAGICSWWWWLSGSASTAAARQGETFGVG